jgi:glutamate--cysteine ligase
VRKYVELGREQIPAGLFDRENAPLLSGILRGVEKESLRVTPTGCIALTDHPRGLGSALTHPQITTDFSESLLEFITPPSHRVTTLLDQLTALHRFTYQHIEGEFLWGHSMPCLVGSGDDIPVARYGTTNRGKMKTVYRIGLGHRYGRVMQTVAGVHYNFSLPSSFWAFMHQHEGSVEELDQYTTRRYFDLIRNFRRHYWLLIYLFGASPALCSSFVKGRSHNLQSFGADEHTLHLPYATSLRMGDLGYQSKAQEKLYVCYNSLESYVRTLGRAISTPYEPYEHIGVQDEQGNFKQLNTSLLQIENEFYSAIRPKRTAQKGETALTALCRRGVEYIEVRCLDIDPFSPTGVSAAQVRFLDTFLIYCALQDSPPCDTAEFQLILANQKTVVTEGRHPGAQLRTRTGETLSLQTWGSELLDALQPIAELLDQVHGGSDYIDAWREQSARMADPEQTPSARVLRELRAQGLTFHQWAMQQSQAHREHFLAHPLSPRQEKRYADMAEESLAQQAEEESRPQGSFATYLRAYYEQYRECCGGQSQTSGDNC